MELTLRNASLADMVNELREQRDRKVDLIVPGRDLWSHNGNVIVRGAGEPTLTDTGVTTSNLTLTPSNVYDDGLAAKLGLPRAYLRRLRSEDWTDLVDQNVNGLLHGFRSSDGTEIRESDPRRFLLRTFRGEGGGDGYARALLSDSYKTIDNWDVLMAALSGMKDAGMDGHVVKSADLTDRKMYVKIVVPEISVLAPGLLNDYKSPYSGLRGADNPTVFAGFVLSNSETGNGMFSLTPRLEIEICTNGMTITQDAVSRRHLGARLEDDGVVRYSEATQKANLDLIVRQTSDAVKTFLDVEYMQRVIDRMHEQMGKPVSKPQEIVTQLTRRDVFSKEDAEGLLDHFIRGGQMTTTGVFNAITSYAQTFDDADRAYAMEADALAAVGLSGISGR